MSTKAIAILVVFTIFILPFLVKVIFFSTNLNNDPAQTTKQAADIIANAAIPWWLGPMQWFAGIGGLVGALSVLGLILFLKWIGEIR